MAQVEAAYKQTTAQAPKWTIRKKPEMVIGGNVPSWTNSIPGPKYTYNLDQFKKKQPVYTMRGKPEMVIGGNVPSWTNSIPGPKYLYDTDVIKPRQPVYTMGGGRQNSAPGKLEKAARNGDGAEARGSGASTPTAEAMDRSFNTTRPTPPKWSIVSRTEFVSGAAVPSWVKSIPGPQYTHSVDTYKEKRPAWSVGKKLPTEGEIMSVRSPGPARYSGTATDAKKQAEVDSTRERSFAPSFGKEERWEGLSYQMSLIGALNRYERPPLRRG